MKTMNVMVDPQKKYILTTEGEQNESWRIHSRRHCKNKTQGEVAVHIANIKTYQTMSIGIGEHLILQKQ